MVASGERGRLVPISASRQVDLVVKVVRRE
jgi:hypothetical protein